MADYPFESETMLEATTGHVAVHMVAGVGGAPAVRQGTRQRLTWTVGR